MNEKFLIKLVDCKNNYMISGYYTTNWSEAYKMYYFMKENEVTTIITTATDEERPSPYDGKEYFIEDLAMQFGSKIGLNVLEVYVRVV